MKSLEQWLKEYGSSHTHPTNIIIHKICVPLITFAVFGILWSIPFPFHFTLWINWATLFFLGCGLFYYRFGLKLLSFMMFQGLVCLFLAKLLAMTGFVFEVSITIFVLAWIMQFIGHKIETKKPSFFKDIQFLLIGPIWVSPFFKSDK